jgi:lactoylglutathione lyase
MAVRAFPVVYASNVERTAQFWELLGFGRFFSLPDQGTPGYVGLRRDEAELAVVATEWPEEQYGRTAGNGPRFEMFVYVTDVDQLIPQPRTEGVAILRNPADMPGGERIVTIADPRTATYRAGKPEVGPLRPVLQNRADRLRTKLSQLR